MVWRPRGFGLYFHWPFCESKCPYCDFNSHVARQVDQRRWAAAYLAEIRRMGQETTGWTVNTVFFGGGTPSLMQPELVSTILEAVRAEWPCANDLEITLEANPGSVEAGRFAGYHAAGVNRVSMGIQSFDDGHLRRLGRLHSSAEALAALEIARNCFERVSFDLIYARQHQTLAEWKAELQQALALGTGHLSLYQLTIEDGTAFGDRHRAGRLRGLPAEDLSADMYELTQALCDAAGLPAYEISNHAVPGQESRHNLIYWNGGDYAGIGPGAHGRLDLMGGQFATEAVRSPEGWLRAVEGHGSGELIRSRLSSKEQIAERIMMGLRLSSGLATDGLESHLAKPEVTAKLEQLAGYGLVALSSGRITVTPAGRLVLNAILRELIGG